MNSKIHPFLPTSPPHRIAYLDGLRGAAILMVLSFHAYCAYPNLYSFGDKFSHSPLVIYGWLGVHLFFLISGFVILMTLEKCRSFREFIWRRWSRLFPAMLICSAIVFATASLFPERPKGAPEWIDLLPGLTFTEPSWWRILIRPHPGILEGAFWSLVVEVKFYVVFGFLYFRAGWKKAVGALIILYAISIVNGSLSAASPSVFRYLLYWPARFTKMLSATYFGWFAAGALFYRYSAMRSRLSLAAAIGMVLASAATVGPGRGSSLVALGIGLLFASSILHPSIQRALSNPFFLFMGFISYPLYLLHENMLVAMIVKVGRAAPRMPAAAVPLLPIAGVIVLAWPIARWLEPWTRNVLRPKK